MVTPAAQREAVAHLRSAFDMSERRAYCVRAIVGHAAGASVGALIAGPASEPAGRRSKIETSKRHPLHLKRWRSDISSL
jgi:hypothetical protein